MEEKSKAEGARRGKLAPAGVVFALAGLVLFAYFIWRAGPGEVWSNITQIGWWFAPILLLAGLRFAVRVRAWTLCFEEPHRLGFWEAFKAYLIGDAAGNVVPLGIVVSEPTKAAMASRRGVPFAATFSAIAVENLFYMLSVALFILGGAAALLLSFHLPKVLRYSSYGIVVGAVLFILFAFYAVRREWRFLSAALRWTAARGLGKKTLERRLARVGSFEERIYGFYSRNRHRFPGLFLFESVNRIITVVFKFVPLRAGIDELGTGQLAQVLAFGVAAGVTLAVVRKARMLFWMAVGVILLLARGLNLRTVAAEAERAQATALGEKARADAVTES